MSRFYEKENGFVSPKYWFYRDFMRFMHKHGWHYAPKEFPIGEHATRGLGNLEVKHWRHWCKWCGLRGETLEIEVPKLTKDNKDVS